MVINGQEVYLYSPFDLKRWSEDEVEAEVSNLVKRYDADADTMYQLSLNVELLANINYLYGEMVARITRELALLKMEIDAKESKMIYLERKNWVRENPGEKAPAMSYFEARAIEIVAPDRVKQYFKQEQLTRFKYAYDSMEEKMNAIKKKMESIKYEEFGQ